jgi:hypothetical protein
MMASGARITVSDICREAIALKVQGLAPRKIAFRLIDLANDNDMSIRDIGLAGGGFELHFEETGEAIHFDGEDWHHRKASS